jgi:uridine phosphorylase
MRKPAKVARAVRDAEPPRQYHLGLAPGEVADAVLLVGDPARAELAVEMLDRAGPVRRNREYVSARGSYQGLPVSVISTGIGPDNMEIAVVELSQCVARPTLIRCGTSGGLAPDVAPGDLVISHAAYRIETTSLHFVGEGYPAVSDPTVLFALVQAADDVGERFHVGLTATAPGFYGSQGRPVAGFPLRNPHLLSDLQAQGIMNLEMEVSALFTLAGVRGLRAGALCAVFGNRLTGATITLPQKEELERRSLRVCLQAFVNLARLDRARGRRHWWHPGLGTSPARRRPALRVDSRRVAAQKGAGGVRRY